VVEEKESIKQKVVEKEVSIKSNQSKSLEGKVIFRVQVETSDRKIQLDDPQFKGLEVFEYKQNGIYKYTVGNFINDYNGAINYRREILKKGFTGAFIVAFFNNERIILEKAIKLAKK